MTGTDPLATARGLLADLLDRADELPAEVSLDVCAALNQLQLPPGALPAYPHAPADPAPPVQTLRAARAAVRAALPDLVEPAVCLQVATAVAYVDDALAGLVTP